MRLMRAQERREFNAVGRYQMIPETFKAGVKSLGLSGHERMTPELQDRFFHDFLIKKAGGGDALAYIQGKSNDINRAMTAMARGVGIVSRCRTPCRGMPSRSKRGKATIKAMAAIVPISAWRNPGQH